MDPLAFRTYDEQSMAGKILHIDRNGHGLPGHPFCPANTNLDAGLHEGLGGRLSQPLPLQAPSAAG